MGVLATLSSPTANLLKKSTASDKLELNMSTKDCTVEEREEGEIIDEFEDIISSDEEFSMRQRIQELEAKNAELEKIANISGVYGGGAFDYTKKDLPIHQTDRYPLISIDISDDEEYPPAPPMSRITKRQKSLQQHPCPRRKMIHHSTAATGSHRHRKKSSSPPPAPLYRPSDKLLLSMFHDRVAAHSSHSSSKRKRKSKKSHSTKTSRKSRDYYLSDSDGDHNFDSYNVDIDDSYENYSHNHEEDKSFSINREELRVALARNTHRNEQHVSLKDRLIRRKENTDTLNEKSGQEPQGVAEEEGKRKSPGEKTDTEDEQELRIIALKSAVIRKHLVRKKRDENVAYSPSDFDENYANIAMSPINNIDDGDACNSMEISPVPSPKLILSDEEGIDTKPVDMDIVNSDSDCELPSYEKWVPIEQIPLPNSMEMTGKLYVPTPLRYDGGAKERSKMPPEVRFKSPSVSPEIVDSEVEEEELALRALLLAKMNSPKVNKIVKEEPQKIEIRTPDPDVSLEAEVLRNFLINNMKKKAQPKHSSESVLKEAVRRLTANNSSGSPVEGLSALSKVKVNTVLKTAEETEIDLTQAISEMARVNIKVESEVKPEKHSKKEFYGDIDMRRDYMKPKETIAIISKEVVKQEEVVKGEEVDHESGIDPMKMEGKDSVVIEEVVSECIDSKKESQSSIKNSDPTEKTEIIEEEKEVCETEVEKEAADSDISVLQDKGSQEILSSTVIEILTGSETSTKSIEDSSSSMQGEKYKEESVPSEKKLDMEEKDESQIRAITDVVPNSLSETETTSKLELKPITDLDKKPNNPEIVSKTVPVSVKEEKIVDVATKDKPIIKAISQSVPKALKPKAVAPRTLPIVAEIKKEKPDQPVSKKPTPVVSQIEVPKLDKLVSKKLPLFPKENLPSAQVIQKPTPKPSTQQSIISRTKIVKPNKVINKQTIDLKRKPTDNIDKNLVLSKKLKTDDSANNRLITAAAMPQVEKLIIELRASDTESEYSAMSAGDDCDDYDEENSGVRNFLNGSITVGNEYYDIASPISLPMESPCDTPTNPASPVVSQSVTPIPQPVVGKSIVNDFFEAKLDQFLKNVRSKVSDSTKNQVQANVTTVATVINTPVAVRHLPEASQQEYRRLINRINLLERQKQAKNLKVIVNTASSVTVEESRTVKPVSDSKTLARKVLIKNASVKPAICDKKIVQNQSPEKHLSQKSKIPEKSCTIEQKPGASPKSIATEQKSTQSQSKSVSALKTSKENLFLYENNYRKMGTSIIMNLDKSLELVMVAREAKMAKLKHEHRLKELRKEMEEEQRNLQQQQDRITKIYPEICSNHRVIESLKTRRVKINKALTALGRSVIGPNYSMNNDQKSIISEKSKKLTAEIKFVNNMKLSDIEKLENTNSQSSLDDATAIAAPKDLNSLTEKSSSAIENEMETPSSLNKVPEGDSENPDNTTAATISMPEIAQNNETNLNDPIAPETLLNKEETLNKDDQNDTTTGHKEALEIETVDDDKQKCDLKEVGEPHEGDKEEAQEEEKEQVGGTKLQDYVSPLSHLRGERQINPNGIVCPYQLMGQCDDKDCKYMHLDE